MNEMSIENKKKKGENEGGRERDGKRRVSSRNTIIRNELATSH